MKLNDTDHDLSLLDVQLAFESWRAQRNKRQPTPGHLRSLAVALLEHHVPFTVCKALGINSAALKQWMKEEPAATQRHFVTLSDDTPTIPVSDDAQCSPLLMIALPNGVQLNLPGGYPLIDALQAAYALPVSTT